MPRIEILNDTLASQVAAGEVVERPASIVKELVENSLDADAEHVTVEIQRGGTAMVKVSDDGVGMSRDDALLSLERHATSKLKRSEQLASIMTLGFRGEAVPSIASVSQFRIITREKGAVVGTEIQVMGGSVKEVRDAGGAVGTVVEAKQIFYNIPARRKFLRAETTESAHVEHQVRLHALAAPQVRFTFIKDGRTLFDLPATHDWRVRIAGLTGNDAARELIEIPSHPGKEMKVRGYLLPAEFARRGKRQQFVFMNGRPIEDAAISRALRDGFRGAIVEGTHPVAWLWLDIDPTLVDVNVHPAKREVRFHRPHEIRNLIADAVMQALCADAEEPLVEVSAQPFIDHITLAGSTERMDATNDGVSANPPAPQRELTNRVEQQKSLSDRLGETMPKSAAFELIGPLHDRYIVMQGEEGVVLLDPIAARERVTYETILRSSQAEGIDSQGLLVPEILELEALDAELVLQNANHFADAGMIVEEFGGNTIKISSMPSFFKISNVRSFLLELVDELHETVGTRRAKAVAFDVFAAGVARRMGRREPCRLDLAEGLLESMFSCDLPYCTPDGRPTLIHISLNELDRKFGK
jgi:DNA mismatch repair protein MutL